MRSHWWESWPFAGAAKGTTRTARATMSVAAALLHAHSERIRAILTSESGRAFSAQVRTVAPARSQASWRTEEREQFELGGHSFSRMSPLCTVRLSMNTAPIACADDCLQGMMPDFLDEAGGLLSSLNEDLLMLELWTAADEQRTACDPELMNNMFRSAHSLKGLAAMLGLGNINQLTHRLESVFDASPRGSCTSRRRLSKSSFSR